MIMKPSSAAPSTKIQGVRERASATRAKAGTVLKRHSRSKIADQPLDESLPAGSAVEQAAQPFPSQNQSAQSPAEGLGEARNRDGADGGGEPAGETAMGRHESFENATPIAEGLLSGTMLNWLPTGDPILPVIEEARRLWLAHDALFKAREDGPESEQESDAHSAMWAHVRGPLLETVPLTAEGCRALARFAVEYSADQGVPLAESDSGQDPVLALIARSPLADPSHRFDAVRGFGVLPVSALIEAHRVARARMFEACNPADEEFVRQAGGDTSDEAMASGREVLELAIAAEGAAWETLLASRPDDAAGLAEMLRYIALSPATEIVGDPKYLLAHIAEAAAAVCHPESDTARSAEGGVSPELRNLIDQHHALVAQFSDEALTEAQADLVFEQAYEAFRSACAFQPAGPADVFAKFALMLPEIQETAGRMSTTAQYAIERLAVDLSMPAAAAWLDLRRPSEAHAPAETSPVGVVSSDLERAVEAHREACQIALQAPDRDPDRRRVVMARIRQLADAVRDVPARSPADLRHKVIYLWPGNIEGMVVGPDLAKTLSTFASDTDRLGYGARPAPQQPKANVSAGLVDLLAQWARLGHQLETQGVSDAVVDEISPRHTELQVEIGMFPCRSMADLRAKVPVFLDEMASAVSGIEEGHEVEDTLPGSAWLGVIRDIERLADISIASGA